MRQPSTPPDLDEVERFVVTVLEIADAFYRTVSSLLEGFDELEDSPFPGENSGEILIKMIAGTVRPAFEAAGVDAVREAEALILAMHDRMIGDLRGAYEIARAREGAGEGPP